MFDAMDRDWDIDALMGFYTPDVVWDSSETGLGTYEGVAAVREFIQSWWLTWEEHHHKIEEILDSEILDLGFGVTFVARWGEGRPLGSTASVQARAGHVAEWKQRMVTWIKSYLDPDGARAASERLAQERG
jgi:ketosteroid isomerase-like protein